MAVEPISSLSFKNNCKNNVQFKGRNEGEAETSPISPRKAGLLKTVPVVVMMTLSPSLLDGAAHASSTQVPEPVPTEKYKPEIRNGEPYYPKGHSSYTTKDRVVYEKMVKINNKDYRLCFAKPYDYVDNPKIEKKVAPYIFLVPTDWQAYNPMVLQDDYNKPPVVENIIVHGYKDENGRVHVYFTGVKLKEIVWDYATNNKIKREYEIKLPITVANEILGTVQGKNPEVIPCKYWQNYKKNGFIKTTPSRELEPLVETPFIVAY